MPRGPSAHQQRRRLNVIRNGRQGPAPDSHREVAADVGHEVSPINGVGTRRARVVSSRSRSPRAHSGRPIGRNLRSPSTSTSIVWAVPAPRGGARRGRAARGKPPLGVRAAGPRDVGANRGRQDGHAAVLSKLNRPDAGVSPWTAMGAVWTGPPARWHRGSRRARQRIGSARVRIEQIALDEVGVRCHAGVALDIAVALARLAAVAAGHAARSSGVSRGHHPPRTATSRRSSTRVRETPRCRAKGDPTPVRGAPPGRSRWDRRGDIQADVAEVLNVLGHQERVRPHTSTRASGCMAVTLAAR